MPRDRHAAAGSAGIIHPRDTSNRETKAMATPIAIAISRFHADAAVAAELFCLACLPKHSSASLIIRQALQWPLTAA
jgi:hypothetical protein